MLTRMRRRVPDRRDDAGMTLMELIVTMTLSTIVMAITLNFFVGSLHLSDSTTSDSINTAHARNILDSWSSLIRVADSPTSAGSSADRFEQIGPDDLIFYANLDNRAGTTALTAPEKIWLSLSDGQLIEKRYLADNPDANPALTPYTYSTYPSQPATTRVLAGCQSGASTATCGTPGTVSSPAAFVAYYTATGCPSYGAAGGDGGGSALSEGGLCTVDPASPASLDDAIAVGVDFTLTAPDGKTSKTFSTLASVTGSSA